MYKESQKSIHDMTAFEVWSEYRRICRNSTQLFSSDPMKVAAWKYAISESREAEAFREVTVNDEWLRAIMSKYAVASFAQFPESTKRIYREIARCFAPAKVYACGSRVTGAYIDESKGADNEATLCARALAGRSTNKRKSDFDFWVSPYAVQVRALPPGADRCRLRIPDNQKILIV